jgi:lipopolysaccharide export system permease protein
VICSVIVVSQLVRLSEVLVTFGLSLENVFLPFLFIILPFLSLAIPMANLFAVVLTYGRLSADGEYAALLAAGYSLARSAVPVMLIAVLLYGAGAASAMYLEAWGRRELIQFLYRKTQTELDNMVKYKMQSGVFLDDFLGYVLYAEKISDDRTQFENVLLAPGGRDGNEEFSLLAPSGQITGSVETGDLKLSLNQGTAYARRQGTEKVSLLRFERAEIDLLRIFHDQIIGSDAAEDDYRSYTPTELAKYVSDLEAAPQKDPSLYRRAAYLFHSRIASPFAAITFALFGMVLGVSDPRRGKSTAYIGAIATIMGGYVLMMGCKWLAENGHASVIVSAWLPNVLLGGFGLFLVFQKNRLPPSEGTLDARNLPLLGRLYKR